MIYQDPLQKNQNLMESNSVVGMESVQSPVESNQQNIDSSVIPTMAQNAIERLHKQKEEVVRIPDWRVDQILRTGGTAEEIERMTSEINKKMERDFFQGEYDIISAVPEYIRSREQHQMFHDLEQELKKIDNITNDRIQGFLTRSEEDGLIREIDSIGNQISEGFGNEQALDRGIELEKKLEQLKNNQTLETENTATSEIVTEKEPELNQNEQYIANLKRDELNQLYGILEKIGPIDGIAPDQLFATIKIFMRGASDDSLIPETYGLRAKMNEIKRIRDTELSYHGFTIDKESGAITAEQINSSEPPQEDGEEQVTDIVTESVPMRVPEVVAMVEESELSSEIAESAQIEEKHDPKEIMRKQQDVLAHKIFKSQSFKELLDVLGTEPLVQNDTASQPTMIVQQSILRYLQGYQIGNPPSIYSITTIHATELRVEQLIEEATKKGNLNELIEEAMKAYPGLVEKESLTVIDVPTNFSEQVGNMTGSIQEKKQEEVIDANDPMVAFLNREYNLDLIDRNTTKEDLKKSIEENIPIVEEKQTTEVVENKNDQEVSDQLSESEIKLSQQEDLKDLEDNYEEDSYEFEKRLFESLITYSGEEGIFALLGTRNLSLSKDGYIIADGKETNYTPSMIDLNAEIQKNTGMTPHQLRENIRDQISHEKNNQKIEIKQTPETEKKKPEDLFLDDNDQEHIELPEKKDFSHVKSFDELYALIDSIKEIQDSERTYSNESLKQIINNVRKGDAILGNITNTKMLRDKVRELLTQERSK